VRRLELPLAHRRPRRLRAPRGSRTRRRPWRRSCTWPPWRSCGRRRCSRLCHLAYTIPVLNVSASHMLSQAYPLAPWLNTNETLAACLPGYLLLADSSHHHAQCTLLVSGSGASFLCVCGISLRCAFSIGQEDYLFTQHKMRVVTTSMRKDEVLALQQRARATAAKAVEADEAVRSLEGTAVPGALLPSPSATGCRRSRGCSARRTAPRPQRWHLPLGSILCPGAPLKPLHRARKGLVPRTLNGGWRGRGGGRLLRGVGVGRGGGRRQGGRRRRRRRRRAPATGTSVMRSRAGRGTSSSRAPNPWLPGRPT